jgi:alkyl sulfatase BDS1-like metallo-beta-lactamase superfamily hydrolase
MTQDPTATDVTKRRLAAAVERLPMQDTRDFVDAERGFIATREDRQIRVGEEIVWDLDGYPFLDGPAPDTAHPSLWRQGQLCAKDGLFEVVPGIYQVRGFDLSNMTLVEGDEGVVMIDTLLCKETAAAAWALYREHRGERPLAGIVYTHSHIDHFGGVKGIVDQAEVDAGRLPIIAPEGFMDHAIAENVFAGVAMARRAGYMYGAAVPKGPTGMIGTGLGQTTSTGETTLIPPTVEITATGQELTVGGVRMVFQLTPDTEAPAEMHIYFPDFRALCSAENATHVQHNILTIRGAVVRDAHRWAGYLTETIALFGDELEVVFASHHWPTWERERAVEFLALQRDLYAYLHDQTLRLLNQGFVADEIAEQIELPPALRDAWHVRGYYGSVSHNVRAIYQRYLGFYDGNPAHLWPHPPVEAARRYVAAMGGADAAVAIARHAFDEGDYRWAAEVLNQVLFDDETHGEARALQADTLEQLGFGSENGTWRNAYLAGAQELRQGRFGTPIKASGIIEALTVEQVLTSIAIRIDGPRAWGEHLVVSFVITDTGNTHVAELRNGALNHRLADAPATGSTTLTLSRPALIGLATRTLDIEAALGDGRVRIDGDPAVLGRLVGLLAPVDPDFGIVTP